MMVSEIDIYRSANLIVQQHGDEARTHAATRADELLAAGDAAGGAVWLRIARAVDELQRDRLGADTPVH